MGCNKMAKIDEWLFTYGWIPILIVVVGFWGFIIWVIIKLLAHFGVI